MNIIDIQCIAIFGIIIFIAAFVANIIINKRISNEINCLSYEQAINNWLYTPKPSSFTISDAKTLDELVKKKRFLSWTMTIIEWLGVGFVLLALVIANKYNFIDSYNIINLFRV